MADPTSPFAKVLGYLVNQVPEEGPPPKRDPTGVGYVNVDMSPRDYAKALAEAINWLTPSGGEESIASLPGGFFRRRPGELNIDPNLRIAKAADITALHGKPGQWISGDPIAAAGYYHPRKYRSKKSPVKPIQKANITQENFGKAATEDPTYQADLRVRPFAVKPRGISEAPEFAPFMMSVENKRKVETLLEILNDPQLFDSFRHKYRKSTIGPYTDVWGDIQPSVRGRAPYRTPEQPKGLRPTMGLIE